MVIDFILAFKQLLVQQDEEAFNKFYMETVDIFFRYLRSNYFIDDDDMQDIIADFYIKCWNGFPTFDLNQNFSGWVWSVFKNTLKDFWKKKWETAFSEIDLDGEITFEDSLEDEEDFTQILDNEYTFEQIQQAIWKHWRWNSDKIQKNNFNLCNFYNECSYVLHPWIESQIVRLGWLPVRFLRNIEKRRTCWDYERNLWM